MNGSGDTTAGGMLADVLDALASERPVAAEARRRVLEELLGGTGPDGALASVETLKKGVHRLAVATDGVTRSVVAKRLAPDVAQRTAATANRWLPAVGLGGAGPGLLRTVADGASVWHVFEDLGPASLSTDPADPRDVEEAVEVVAALHTRFAEHPLLAECRLWGGDLGICSYRANVVDALRALEALSNMAASWRREHRAARELLLRTLRQMHADEDRRCRLVVQHGGPETLLHGDLWRQNVALASSADGVVRPRLIDWDHVAVGHVSYDLSTLLTQFPSEARGAILDVYRRRVAAAGWRLPADAVLNDLFEIAERSRIANRVIWPALVLRTDGSAEWAVEQLAEVSRWFQQLEPVLP